MNIVNTQDQELESSKKLYKQAFLDFDNANSANTKKSYSSDWQDFKIWCESKGFKSLPSCPEVVALYISDRGDNPYTRKVLKKTNGYMESVEVEFQPLKPSSLERRLAAIKSKNNEAGLDFDSRSFVISRVMQGIKRRVGTKQVQKKPLLLDDIKEMTREYGSVGGIRDRAIILLGFSCALRKSELVNLQLRDLTKTSNGYLVNLRFSKTDQTGKGYVKTIVHGSNLHTCPVRALDDWLVCLDVLELKASEKPLFRAVDRFGRIGDKKLGDSTIALIIKRSIKSGDSGDYSGHSLRAGFCTQAAISGVSPAIAMKQSGHKSVNTYVKYVRVEDNWKDCAAGKLGL